MSLRNLLGSACEQIIHSRQMVAWRMQDVGEATRRIYHRVAPYTMTSPERIAAVCDAIRYVVDANIPGAYVECGVWRGGSSMAAALTLIEAGDRARELRLFDTFEGMTTPSAHDVRASDNSHAGRLLKGSKKSEKIWCRASIDDVMANMASTGYPADKIVLCRGMVEETLPSQAPERIAVLRLDTDWYESTKHELETLYPRLSPGGVLIIDDYGYWAGARKAVDDYFAERPILLNRVDRTGRIAVKL
ncbi:MAG TPA: TylF/MycF/NovP-related O-methyltransferase [Sphingomicrobium sp.]|nr:TylF/MycF/NovP-related O-methyltransferase [Sphingomicrobium sp.]